MRTREAVVNIGEQVSSNGSLVAPVTVHKPLSSALSRVKTTLYMQTPQLEQVGRSADSPANEALHPLEANWLNWLHEMLPDAAELLLFAVNPNQTIELRAVTPEQIASSESVSNAVLSCVHRKKALYLDSLPSSDKHLLAIPFQNDSSVGAYVLVMLTAQLNSIQQNTAVQLAQWAGTRLNDAIVEDSPIVQSAGGPEVQLSEALMGALDRHGTFKSLAFALVNTLAHLCGCVRVSLGSYDGRKLRLVAMSGQSKIDDRRKIARQLCALMQETVVSRRAMYPIDDAEAAPALQSYYKSQGEHPLLSFVMPGTSSHQYLLVLERGEDNPFIDAQADAIEQSVHKLGTLLDLAETQELSLRKKALRQVRKSLSHFVNFDRWSRKQWVLGIACCALLLTFFIPVTHRISADATIEASDRQVLVVAQDGFILTAHARAGEVVSKGDLLATLDGQNLELAADKWRSEKTKNQQEYAQALAIHDRSELSRLRADAQRIDAEIALLEQQLRRSEVRAPFDGVLLEGDWTQSLGAPVSTGDVLFEIASAEQYRLILEIDEHDIGYIKPEQFAQLRMAALPTTVWEAELGDVMPVAISEKGSSAFRVPATIEGDASALRPGMAGVGKVSIGNRSMFWVYSHKLVNKVRYLAWKVGVL